MVFVQIQMRPNFGKLLYSDFVQFAYPWILKKKFDIYLHHLAAVERKRTNNLLS